jgi:hypothetical protein
MNAKNRLSALWNRLCSAELCLLLIGTSCASQGRFGDPAVAPHAAPVRVESIEVQTQGQVQALAAGASIRAQQDFALKLRLDQPLYLYVVIEHADQRRDLLRSTHAAAGLPSGAGSLRVPAAGDWFFLPTVLAGDRLCLIAGVDPQNNFSCAALAEKSAPGRGEDQPPPPPPPPREAKAPDAPKRPPPPDDTDRDRGKTRWVLPLPLSTP